MAYFSMIDTLRKSYTVSNAEDFCFKPHDDRDRNILFNYTWSVWLCFPPSLRFFVYRTAWKISDYFTLPKRDSIPIWAFLPTRRLLGGVYVKYGPTVLPSEGLATQFVAKNTTIPVPTILDIIRDPGGYALIAMTEMPGTPINTQIAHTIFKPENIHKFEDRLRDWINQLRELPPPNPHAVCGYDGGPFFCVRLGIAHPVGPFATIDKFHRRMYYNIESMYWDQTREMAKVSHSKPHRICFTHGDIIHSNILVDSKGNPTALIDWGCSGWLPEYWECTRSRGFFRRSKPWYDLFVRIFPQYEDEDMVDFRFEELIYPNTSQEPSAEILDQL